MFKSLKMNIHLNIINTNIWYYKTNGKYCFYRCFRIVHFIYSLHCSRSAVGLCARFAPEMLWCSNHSRNRPKSFKQVVSVRGSQRCRSRCETLKNRQCSLAVNVAHRSTFTVLYGQRWGFHMNKNLLSRTKKTTKS